mmetsp:Transcript_102183/g.256148  ORF Transcript_102183/g.256148 Transcript_102183/m.256148 type:complete len:265 (-) Transcript_102183:436-1230(-)
MIAIFQTLLEVAKVQVSDSAIGESTCVESQFEGLGVCVEGSLVVPIDHEGVCLVLQPNRVVLIHRLVACYHGWWLIALDLLLREGRRALAAVADRHPGARPGGEAEADFPRVLADVRDVLLGVIQVLLRPDSPCVLRLLGPDLLGLLVGDLDDVRRRAGGGLLATDAVAALSSWLLRFLLRLPLIVLLLHRLPLWRSLRLRRSALRLIGLVEVSIGHGGAGRLFDEVASLLVEGPEDLRLPLGLLLLLPFLDLLAVLSVQPPLL